MCTVHVNQVCDGEVPECYVPDNVLGELVTSINDLQWALENYDGACCGMACDCHQNNKSDLIEAYAELKKLGFQYCGECGELFAGKGFPIGTISNPNCGNCYGFVNGVYMGNIPASVDNAMEAEYPDAF
tara:strand:- start:14 stop:400 length:387 start_codon:yes stop_codon:yes gene_type:complete